MWTDAGYEAAAVGSDWDAVGESLQAALPVAGGERSAL